MEESRDRGIRGSAGAQYSGPLRRCQGRARQRRAATRLTGRDAAAILARSDCAPGVRMPEPPDVSIIIVSWNTADLLAACLRSLRDVDVSAEILVVDNGSTDGSVERVRREFPDVRLIAQAANTGFARANNAGLAAARGRFLLLLNPDTELRRGALRSLVDGMRREPRVGIAGPPLWNPDGSPQPSVQTFPTLGSELLRQTMLHRALPGRLRREARRRDTRAVEVVSGAALCIRRECLESIGPLDEGIFMFYEDTDWCYRAHESGWEIRFVDGPGVVHHKGAASGGASRTRTLLASHRGMLHYFRKHHGPRAVPALRAITLLGVSMRALRAGALLLLGGDRADQRARLSAYGALARWAVRGGEVPS